MQGVAVNGADASAPDFADQTRPRAGELFVLLELRAVF